jgi:amino acid transporter
MRKWLRPASLTRARRTGEQMTERLATAIPEAAQVLPARLEPDAIGAAQDTIIGMANSAPTVAIGLSLAGLAAASAYGSGPVIILCGVPMLVIANAYRRLNLWNANCGASFEWVGRAINPYLGFMAGWLMIAASLVGGIAGVVVLGPSVLAIFGASASATWPNIFISTVVIALMLLIAVVGIRLTARTQVGMGVVEYIILIAFSVAGLFAVLTHHHGTFPVTGDWLSLSGIGGHGSLASGLLIAVFMFAGWDATVYVNEEVKHRRHNPGRAAVIAVALLIVIYTFCQVGLQGVVSPAKLQQNSSSVLVYIAQSLGGGTSAKVMALALALSVIASTGVSIVIIARMLYGMAGHRVLPASLGIVSRRYSTPAIASVAVGVVLIAVTWVYLLSGSIANAFTQLIDVTGVLYASFYILTALSAIVYYRRHVFSNLWDAVLIGILPLGAAAFLVWIVAKSTMSAPASQRWSLLFILGSGLVLMLVARFGLRSSFFKIPRESAPANADLRRPGPHRQH